MKLQVKVAFASLISLILIHQCLCDELSNTSGVSNWTCTCSSSSQGNQSYVPNSNCSTSCDCTAVGESNGDRWACICPADGFPKVAADSHDPTCFTACNCTAGSFSGPQASRKHFSSKIVVVILLLCVILTTLAFVASLMCYIHRKDKGKCAAQTPAFLSDKETSCNSATNLISHKILLPEANIKVGASVNSLTGCFQKASLFCNGKVEMIYGTLIRFSYSELENATNRFSKANLIGLGGSSFVYCGQLKDGRTVAVKRLKLQAGPDGDAIFSTEVELLSRLHHFHVVPLVGYCSEFRGKQAERLLVFEYMPNGNLRDCLDGVSGENMIWSTRVAIAIGAARGLEYLHEAAAPRILHRDVKSTNILLDENWRAKITDLGMAKSLRPDGLPSCSSSPARVQGTFGYFAPEYAIIGRASLMSDVFSFGVVLLELFTGRQPIQKSTDKGEESLVIWATPRLQDSRRVMAELPDPRLKGDFPEEEMQIMAYLAKECLLMDPDARPTMSEVVQILSTITPDKSRRRNIPINLFRNSSVHRVRNETFEAKPVNLPKACSNSAEQLPRAISMKQSPRDLVPVNVGHTFSARSNGKEANAISSDYMERLILLTSRARSWRAQDDETINLTEPRFESFCMANVKSP